MNKFQSVSCSQCGESFGPGNHGFSHCQNHEGKTPEVIACITQMRGELAHRLEAEFDMRESNAPLSVILAKVRAYPAIVRADALIAELGAGEV